MNISLKFKIIADVFKEGADRTEKLKSCIHSGNAGDIIYSLPTVRGLGAEHFIMNASDIPGFGARFLNEKTALSLIPLLLRQSYIKRVSVVFMHNPFPPYFKTENGTLVVTPLPLEYMDGYLTDIDFILDKFRLTDTNHNHLVSCYAGPFGINVGPAEKWLSAEDGAKETEAPAFDTGFKYRIILALTPRYRSQNKDFWKSALEGLSGEILAVGVQEDAECVSGIADKFMTCAHFLELANIINGAELFIGNPSMAYSIAEGLKVPRVVEIPDFPRNAYPAGVNGYFASESAEETRNIINGILKI